MNRTIKFRGLRADGKGWVIGFYCNIENKEHYILEPCAIGLAWTEVIPSTVGQYVGKIGANACEVWEGDKVIARLNHHGKPTELQIPAFISYNEHVGTWQIKYENHAGHLVSDDIGFRYFLEVIGNIHEEKEANNG